MKDKKGNIVETPSQMLWRVAATIAAADLLHDPNADIPSLTQDFYEMMARLDFMDKPTA